MRKVTALLLALTLLICLGGCTKPAQTEPVAPAQAGEEQTGALAKDALIGVVLPTKEESRWLNDQTYFEKIFGEKGYNYEILFSQNNAATEKTNVETLISKGARAIVLCAYDATAAAAAVKDAKAEGITVISLLNEKVKVILLYVLTSSARL